MEPGNKKPERKPNKSNQREKPYKKYPCKNGKKCSNPYCKGYHFLGERIRDTPFEPIPCPHNYNCKNIETCKFSHSVNEVLYHTKNHRATICSYPPEQNFCLLRDQCHCLHGSSEELKTKTKLTQEANALLKESFQKEQELRTLLNNLEVLKLKSKELREKAICNKCFKAIKQLLFYPCLHTTCPGCVSEELCPVCFKSTNMFNINF